MISLKLLSQCPSVSSLPSLKEERLSFCTDTRVYKHPSVFVALPGKLNALDFITPLLEQKCPLIIYENSPGNELRVTSLKITYPATVFLSISSSVKFLQELAHEHITAWKKSSPKNILFAISGSNGKTTHKEMLSCILNEIIPGKVVATEKNNNNHLGVPLTLLKVTDSTEFVILELGSNHPGEIKALCDIAEPTSGITTNIGATHLEFFSNEEAVFKEEAYLFHSIKKTTQGRGFFLINQDDHFLQTLMHSEGSIGFGQNAEVQVNFLNKGASIVYKGKELQVENSQLMGRHNKLNLITCAFIAYNFYPEHQEAILAAAARFTPTANRSQWLEVKGKPVFLDAYNANPSSIKSALLGFKESILLKGYNLREAGVVLGDMNELGSLAEKYHQEVAAFAHEIGFSHIYFIGQYAPFYLQGYPGGSKIEKENYPAISTKHSVHFIKGSRSLKLEELL